MLYLIIVSNIHKTYGGNKDCFLQVLDIDDNETIISLLNIGCWAFFFNPFNNF